jgi:serine/threonine-protein kinase
MLGSPLYMSPEQIQDASTVDERSDIWSLGAVMHELLTGTPPFDSGPIAAVIRAICTQMYQPPERGDLPPDCLKILSRCLRPKREERFQSAEELALAFRPLARTSAAHVSINRILRIRGSAPPPRVEVATPRAEAADSPATSRFDAPLPSVTPVETDTIRSPPPASMLRLFAGAFVVGGTVLTAALWFAPRDASSPAPSATTPISAPAAAARPEREPTPSVPAPVEAKRNDETLRAPNKVAVPPSPARLKARPMTRALPERPQLRSEASYPMPTPAPVAAPEPVVPAVIRKVRPLDTDNPFRK